MSHDFISDERIAELFPDPDTAVRVRIIRDEFQRRYEDWIRAHPASGAPSTLCSGPR